MEPLTDAQIAHELGDRPGWRLADGAIVRTYDVPGGFMAAIGFVNRLADAAEEADHHPDITISWNRVTVSLVTHSAGGITTRDLALADAADGLADPGDDRRTAVPPPHPA